MSARIIPLRDVKAQVALELAAGLIDEDDIEERFGIDNDTWGIIKASPYFERMLKEAADKVSGADNSPKRIRLKAQVALEDSLPVVYGIIHNQDASTAARLEATRTLSKLAGMEAQEAQVGAGFSITINLGDTTATIGGKEVNGSPSVIDHPVTASPCGTDLWGAVDTSHELELEE